MPESLVTVAIPYAGGLLEYLREACISLSLQTFDRWKAVIVDDTPGPTGVSDILNDLSDPRISYQQNTGPHGIGNAWNACVNTVNTDLFCLLHQDDAMEPNYLQTMLELGASHPNASLYFCGATVVNSQGRPCFSLVDRIKDLIEPRAEPVILSGSPAVSSLMVGNYIMCPTIMYRKSKIGERRFSTHHRFVLDLRFTLSLLFDGATIVGTHRRAYRYRRHNQQSTHGLSKDGPRFQEEFDLFREVATQSATLGWRDARLAATLRPTFRAHAALARRWSYVWS